MAKSTSFKQDYQTLYTAFNLYTNWNRMSAAQKAKSLAALGMHGYKFTTGESLAQKWLIQPQGGDPGLTFGQAFGLFSTGVNVYSLARNWKQFSTLQRLSGGSATAVNMAQLAKSFNLLGYGVKGSAVPAASVAQLGTAWSSVPSYGVGAVTASVGTPIPTGYSAVASGGEGIIAVPTANVSSASGAVTGTPLAAWGEASWAGYAGAAFEGATTIANLGKVPEDDRATYLQKHAGLAVADVYTAGGASAAYALLMNTSIGRKLDKAYNKLDKAINPVTRIANHFNTDKWKTEGNRLAKLRENGVYIPDNLFEELPTRGRSKEELVAIAEKTGGNVKFAQSRKEADLTGQDIANYSVWAEKDPDWFKRPVEERIAISQQALDAGAVREHHGTVDVDFDKFEFAPQGTPETPEDAAQQRTLQGSKGGSQMQAGLAQMLKTDPYLGGAMLAHSAFAPGMDTEGEVSEAIANLNLKTPDGKPIDVHTLPYVIDPNKDLDYFAGLSGITLAQLAALEKSPTSTQTGQRVANGVLQNSGEQGYSINAFNKVRDAFRALYAQAGIQSHADAYRRANTMYAGRAIDDTDLIRMHQVADMIYTPNGYQLMNQFLPGRNRGLQVAKEDALRIRVIDPNSTSEPIKPNKMDAGEDNRIRVIGMSSQDPLKPTGAQPVGQRPVSAPETPPETEGELDLTSDSKEARIARNRSRYGFMEGANGL